MGTTDAEASMRVLDSRIEPQATRSIFRDNRPEPTTRPLALGQRLCNGGRGTGGAAALYGAPEFILRITTAVASRRIGSDPSDTPGLRSVTL